MEEGGHEDPEALVEGDVGHRPDGTRLDRLERSHQESLVTNL